MTPSAEFAAIKGVPLLVDSTPDWICDSFDLSRVHGLMNCKRIAIVGGIGGTHIGGSLDRAAKQLGLEVLSFDVSKAFRANRLRKLASWHLFGHRPPLLKAFSEMVVAMASRSPPDVLIATGAAPLTANSLRALRRLGITCINYSTDDPWNPSQRAAWHLAALPEYDIVFTPRRSNFRDLELLGCRAVHYLPFGYDEKLFYPTEPAPEVQAAEVLFVGGADRDRINFVKEFLQSGCRITLVGGYWQRCRELRDCWVGQAAPERLRTLTASAKVNLCLVRRANRDGHVMRSFEIPAIGGFMIAEDTDEHRELFGDEGRCVLYFKTPTEAVSKTEWALSHPWEWKRMADSAHALIVEGRHTYAHRLQTMLAFAV